MLRVSIFFCLLTFIFLALSASTSSCDTGMSSVNSISNSTDYQSMARQDAIDAGINPDYFERQINEESGFNPNARGGDGEIGIAQFMPSTANGLGINPYDPVDSLKGAANLMGRFYVNYGYNYEKALAAYNAGSGTLARSIDYCGDNWFNCSTMPPSTRQYINSIVY